ncbi:uncharacterized protein LOC131630581 [Vicia villosa]|uniref:uncharacterized protein LOC131630581 n=1 Tax=Vicia villosa TaxID=3911 RepID=UPI00273CBFD4|nr:uncharacterized protein LOC131630581 [Vicia villosa]
MARPLEKVAYINDEKELWKVDVKVHYKWTGSDIHVQLNDLLFKPTPHKLLIKFTGGTRVGDRNNHKIPDKIFNVTPLVDILTGGWNKHLLIDVIRVVDEIGYTQGQVGGKKHNNTINCTVWESYAMQFINYMQQRSDFSDRVVVFIQYAKFKQECGKYPISVANTYNVTKVAINEDLEPIKDIAKSITKENMKALSNHRSSQSQVWSKDSSGSQQTPYHKLMSKSVVLPLAEIIKLTEVTFCFTVATTQKFIASRFGWHYQACHECPRSLKGDKPPYVFPKGHTTETLIYRYKIKVGVVHGSTKCNFVLWDKESEQLLDMSAANMRTMMIEKGKNDPLEFLLALGKMLSLEIAFKVKWQPNWNNCSVVMLLRDKAIINQLKAPWPSEISPILQPIDAPALQIKESFDEATAVDDCNVITVLILVPPNKHLYFVISLIQDSSEKEYDNYIQKIEEAKHRSSDVLIQNTSTTEDSI